MVRITDFDRSRAFYEALGMQYRREGPIVRNGEHEATNYFFGYEGQDEELELTWNTDGRTYEHGTAYGHIALGVDDLTDTLAQLKGQGIEPEREPYRIPRGRRTDLLRARPRRVSNRADRPRGAVGRHAWAWLHRARLATP